MKITRREAPDLTIRTKLLLMGVLMILLVIGICGFGYYKAKEALEASIPTEIEASLRAGG